MSLANRKAQAQKENALKNKIPDGTYQVRLSDWEYKKSQKNKDMYVLKWKLLAPIEVKEEIPEGMKIKGKIRNTYYVTAVPGMLDKLLGLLESTGADLEQYDDLDDLPNIFEAIEDTKMPKGMLTYEHPDDAQFPTKCEISDLEKVLAMEEVEEEEEEDDTPKKKKKVTAPQ